MAAETMIRNVARHVAAHLAFTGVYFECIPLDNGQTMIQVNDSRLPLLVRAIELVNERLGRKDGKQRDDACTGN